MKDTPRILLVEDDEHLAVGIQYNLQAEGFDVTTALDGPAALELAKDQRKRYDLVILDIMLPGMSGYAVCESLRSGGDELPVLMLSARSLAEDRARGFDVGANQYLTKPFDLNELISRVRNLLSRHQPRAEKPLPPLPKQFAFAESVIDFEAFEVIQQDNRTRLTSLEMKLLQYFIRNEGRVIPREEILEKVWELPPATQTRAPDQFLLRLRKIFERNPSEPRHFLTLRDAGYKFVAQPES